MQKKVMTISFLLCLLFMVTGCINSLVKNAYEIDFMADNVLACTSMKYNIFSNYSSKVFENHVFLAEYNESKTSIIKAAEIYTADYSKTKKELTQDEIEELTKNLKTKFCDTRNNLIVSNGYKGDEVTCDISNKDNVITIKMLYPKDVIDYVKSKGQLGTFEEFSKKIENDDMLWFDNNYFICDKKYDKSNFINKEIKETLNLSYYKTIYKASFYNLANELNVKNRFSEEIFEKYKVDTQFRITLNPINEGVGYVEGDYTLTYNCSAQSEEICDNVIDFVIDAFTLRAKDFEIKVTRK